MASVVFRDSRKRNVWVWVVKRGKKFPPPQREEKGGREGKGREGKERERERERRSMLG